MGRDASMPAGLLGSVGNAVVQEELIKHLNSKHDLARKSCETPVKPATLYALQP